MVKLSFIIMRASPFTIAHKSLISKALKENDYLIVFIGSSNAPLNEKNPFPASLREKMIRSEFPNHSNIIFDHLDDFYDNEAWGRAVKGRVNRIKNTLYNEHGSQVTVKMYGGQKDGDSSTFYFKLFKDSFCELDLSFASGADAFSATDIREALYEGKEDVSIPSFHNKPKTPFWKKIINFHNVFYKYGDASDVYVTKVVNVKDIVPANTLAIIREYQKSQQWKEVKMEREFNRIYTLKNQYPVFHFAQYLNDNGIKMMDRDGNVVDSVKLACAYYDKNRPYPVQGNSVDAVVRSNNQYLLIRRKNYPFKGAWALAGGFVDPNETRITAALRELKEEVGMRMNKEELLKCLIGELDLEHPKRDPRFRMFSKAFIFELPDDKENLLKAGSDAASYGWFSFEEIIEFKDEIAFDHLAVLREAEKIRAKTPLRFV